MSDLKTSAERGFGAGRRGVGAPVSEGWRARWTLAGWWMRRFALSYLTTTVFALIVGLFLGLFLNDAVTGQGAPSLLADGFFLLLTANLALNWTSTGYVYVGDEAFSKKVSFLRSLPTSAGDVAGMRLLVLLVTLLAMAPLAFLPPYLVFDAVRETFGPYRYLCFVVLWASYGLVSGCANAYLELGFRARTMLLAQMIWSVVLLAIVVAASAFGGGIVEGSVRLVSSHGTLAAGLSLAVAAGSAYLWRRLAERRLREREFEV